MDPNIIVGLVFQVLVFLWITALAIWCVYRDVNPDGRDIFAKVTIPVAALILTFAYIFGTNTITF
jgi:hypothetical protein